MNQRSAMPQRSRSPTGREPASPAPRRHSAGSMTAARGRCACGGACPRCATPHAPGAARQLTTPGEAVEREADALADSALRSSPLHATAPDHARPGDGALPAALREDFEHRFDADFSAVRIHADDTAARDARALHASAYTVDRDIVFGAGQYAPGTPAGQRLIAHELGHVVQQQRWQIAPGAVIARTPEDIEAAAQQAREEKEQNQWSPAYGADPSKQYGTERGTIDEDVSYTGKDQQQHIRHQPALDAASKATGPNGQKGMPMDLGKELGDDDIKDVMTFATRSYIESQKQQVPADLDARWDANAQGTGATVSEAFRTMQIDTLEAQALYLAHASVEGNWVVNAGRSASTRMTAQADPGVVGQFAGRGPLQVTFQQNYVKTLAYLDEQAKRLDAQGKADDAAKARATSAAIKADPAKAADPQYAYIFSAAMMQASGGVQASAEMNGRSADFGGTGPEDRWETGGDNFDERIAYWTAQKAAGNKAADERMQYWTGVKRAGQRKTKAYNRALEVLRKNLLPAPAATNPAPAAAPAAAARP